MSLSNDDSDVSSSLFEDVGNSDDDADDDELNRSALILQKLVNRESDLGDDDMSSDGEVDILGMEVESNDEKEEESDDEKEEELDEDSNVEDGSNVEDEHFNNDTTTSSTALVTTEQPVAVPVPYDANDDDDDDDYDSDEIQDKLQKKPKEKKKPIELKSISSITADDNEDDIAMKALLTEWGVDKVDESQDKEDDIADDDDNSEVSERMVQLDDGFIDHIVLAAPDLEEALVQFEEMAGIGAKIFGSVNGIGIRCARISFNESSYLEIIAPDANKPGPIGQLIKAKGIKDMTPFAFAIRSSRTEQLKDEVGQFNYVPDHISMFGGKKDGTPRNWEMLHLYGHKLGGICPYFVNWDTTDHPCATLPVVGKLKKFTIRAPSDDPIHELFAHVGVRDMNIEMGTPKMSFQFSSPEGTIKFATSKAVGYKFPGFDDEEHGLDSTTGAKENDSNDEVVFESPESPELLEIESGDYETLPAPAY